MGSPYQPVSGFLNLNLSSFCAVGRQCAFQVTCAVKLHGVLLQNSDAVPAVRRITGLDLNPNERTALNWLEKYFWARETPQVGRQSSLFCQASESDSWPDHRVTLLGSQRYAQEVTLLKSFESWADARIPHKPTAANQK